eukprot:TRINITY_DN110705_c0_g1_i1.p1 TRINITY_DN110705_c0_g1~~TRINITY_DN110705_c0_g1_i1.p1  ORF type:complete len:324 (+),score=60.64 TRINITY_DN110705_c0_g1_i1:32-1003(+)
MLPLSKNGCLRPTLAMCRRHFSSQVGSVSSALVGASKGNLVRFLCPAGYEHWGALSKNVDTEDLGSQRAQIVKKLISEDGSWPVTEDNLGDEVEISELLSPLPVNPAPAVIVMGLNYVSHAAEVGKELPLFPVFTYKSPTSIIATGSPICLPECARKKPEVDFEAELAIVIGRLVKDATPSTALDAILGITAANDVSARRWQGKKGGGQWSRSKSFDTFCPLGPSIAPISSQVLAGGAGLRIRSIVNGNMMQDCSTSDMRFGLGELVSYLSEGTTLLPGTIILTGTPPGVGYVRSPPVYLAEGDTVEVELEGVGRLKNPVENV